MSQNTTQYGTIEKWYQDIKKQQKKDIENSKDRQTGTKRGYSGTANTGVTRNLNNPLKGERIPIPQNPDNPLK